MAEEKKSTEQTAEHEGEKSAPPKKREFVSRFKKPGAGFGSTGPSGSGKPGYKGPQGPVGGSSRTRGANRGR